MLINSSDRMVLGTSTNHNLAFITNSGTKATISTAGDMTISGCLIYNGGTSGSCLSDERLKTDVRRLGSRFLNNQIRNTLLHFIKIRIFTGFGYLGTWNLQN